MFDGDVNLSCTMTFISSIGSFAFTTMWVFLLGAPMVGKSVPIPYLQLTVSLAMFVAPLLLGVLVNYKLSKLAVRLRKLSRPFFLLLLIIFPVVGSLQNLHFFYLCQWQHFLAGIGLGKVKCPLHSPDNMEFLNFSGFLGYGAGALLARIFKQGRQQVKYRKQSPQDV